MKYYIKAAFDTWVPDWLKADKEALKAIANKGIDLKHATFSREKSGKLSDNIVVYYLQEKRNSRYSPGYTKNIVWIPGTYHDDEYVDDPYDGKSKAIKYISKKNLPIVDVVYINVNEDTNKKPYRARYQDPRYDTYGKYAGQYYTEPSSWTEGGWSKQGRRTSSGRWGRDQKRDKSGYAIPNPDERLLKFYGSKEGIERLATMVTQVHDQLVDMKSKLFNLDFDTFGKDYDGTPSYSSSAYQNILHTFGDMTRDYRIVLHQLEQIKQISESSEDHMVDTYYARESYKTLRQIKNRLKQLDTAIEKEYY